MLIEPFESLPGAEERRYALISAAFLLTSVIGVLLEQMIGGRTSPSALILLVIGYLIARTRWYKAAILLLMVALSFPSYVVALTVPDPNPSVINNSFIWIILPLILSSLFYSVRTTVLFTTLNVALIFVLPLLRSDLTFIHVSGSIGFYVMVAVFVITLMNQRNQLERDRQGELLENRNQLAEEVANRKKFAEQAQRRADQLVMLNEVSRVISSLHNLTEILDAVLEQVRRVIPLDVFFVALYDEKTETISFPILFDNGSRWQEKPASLQKANRIARVIRSRQPLMLNRTREEMEESRKSDTRLGDRSRVAASALVSPLQVGNRIVGAISAQSYDMNAYGEEHLMLLTAIAQQVVVAIENARLLEQTEKRAQRLAILNDIGRELSALTDLPTLMDNIYQQVQKALSADLFFINLVDKEKNEVFFPFMYDDGRRWEQKPKPMTELDGTFTGKTLQTRQPLLINEWSASADEGDSSPTTVGDDTKLTKSLMYVPVLAGNDTIGVISVQSYRAYAYNVEDLNLLSGIANQVAIAIQNTRLLEETRQNAESLRTLFQKAERQAQELSLLGKIQDSLLQEIELADLMRTVVNSISSTFGYKYISLYLLEGEALHLQHQVGYAEENVIAIIPSNEGVSGRVIQTHDPIFIEDVEKDKEFLRAAADIKSEICIPLFDGATVCGTLNVECADEPLLTGEDLRLLLLVGNQVNSAIRRARLVDEIRQNAKYLSILNEVGQAVAKIMDLPDLLEIVYELGKKSISLDAFFVGLYHPEGDEVSFPIMYDSGERFEQSRGLIGENSFLRRFLNGEKSILMLRTEEEIEKGISLQKTLGRESKLSASLMATPLLSRGQVIGLISAQSYTLNAYDESDLKLLEGIANQVAIAIENSRLYTSAQQEIKERERAEMELQKERDFAVQVMNSLGQGVSVSMLDGVYEYVNPAYAQMLGHKPEDMIGEPSEHFAAREDAGLHSEQRKHRQKGEATTYETRLVHKDGHTVHALVTGVPRYSNGRIIGSISAITDLTERKKAEIEREKLITEMDAKNAELERFTYTVSHDLKSPLVTIGGFLGFLEQDIQKGKYDRLPHTVTRIREAARKMQRLFSELLELSRIGRIANPAEDVPFGELVRETLELVHGQLEEKQVEVQVDAEFPVVHVDRVRMVEVIQNLVANAVKFTTRETSPKIHIGMETREGENIFFVKDNGIGIAPEFHERIFGLFNKLDQFSDGTGIGLTLVKRIVEVHGGRIWVESETGKGATFFFTLENKTQEEAL